MSIKILVAEDEPKYRMILGDFLKSQGYEVIFAVDGVEAIEKFYSNTDIDLILLDIMMPKKDGREVCKIIRKDSNVKVIMLTALGDEENEVVGLNIGADDYIAKPFSYPKLIARIKAVTREINIQKNNHIDIDNLSIDQIKNEVKVDGEKIDMTRKEYELLSFFILNKNIALSREKLLDNVWGYDFFGSSRTVDTHVKLLRSKLGETGDRIKTVWGKGYIFEMDVK